MQKALIILVIIILGFSFFYMLTNKKEDYYTNQITFTDLQNALINQEEKIIYFYQPDCSHCKKINPTIKSITKELNVDIQTFNLKKYEKGWDFFKIQGTPTIVHYKNGKEVNRIIGEQTKQNLEVWFEKEKNEK